jgi:hypothetical protein
MNALPLELFLLIAQPNLGAVCRGYHETLSLIKNQQYILSLYTNNSSIINSNKPFYIRFAIALAARPGWLKSILNGLPPTRIRRMLDQSVSVAHNTNRTLVLEFVINQIPSLIQLPRDDIWDSIIADAPTPMVEPYWIQIQNILYIDYVKQVVMDSKNQKQRNISALIAGLSGPASAVFKFCINRSLQNYIDQPARNARRSRVNDIKIYLMQ